MVHYCGKEKEKLCFFTTAIFLWLMTNRLTLARLTCWSLLSWFLVFVWYLLHYSSCFLSCVSNFSPQCFPIFAAICFVSFSSLSCLSIGCLSFYFFFQLPFFVIVCSVIFLTWFPPVACYLASTLSIPLSFKILLLPWLCWNVSASLYFYVTLIKSLLLCYDLPDCLLSPAFAST